MATVAQASYDVLRAGGLTTIFGNPGSNELKFLAAMPTDFRYVLGLHEGAVISMADGYALASGRTAFVNLHAAVRLGNAMGGLTNAVYSHSPLVVTAGPAGAFDDRAGSHAGQRRCRRNCPAAGQVEQRAARCAQDVPRTIIQAIHTATAAPRGPVYVSVPYDDWDATADPPSATCLLGAFHSAGSLAPDQLADLVDALAAATNPAIVLGPQVDAAQANADAVRWPRPCGRRCGSRRRLPVARSRPGTRRSAASCPPAVAGVTARLAGHDLVLVVGAPVFRYHQYEPGDYLPEGSPADPADRRSRRGRPRAGRRRRRRRREGCAGPARRRRARRRPRPRCHRCPTSRSARTGDGFVHPDEVFALLREHAPADAIYVNESTSTSDSFWSQVDLALPGSYYFPASGGLGFGLPAAVGVQLARPDRQVIGVIGDGSANYGITALWTAARYRIPVVFVILKNGTYGALRGFADLLDTGETPGLDVPGIDFVQIAQGYGVEARAVTTGEEFVLALKSALDRPRPVLIEVATAHLQFHELT